MMEEMEDLACELRERSKMRTRGRVAEAESYFADVFLGLVGLFDLYF